MGHENAEIITTDELSWCLGKFSKIAPQENIWKPVRRMCVLILEVMLINDLT